VHCAIELRSDSDPDPWYVTFGVRYPDVEIDPDLLGNKVSNDFWAGIGTWLSNTVTMTGVDVTFGQDDEEPIRRFVPTVTPKVGESSAAKLPQNCALLVKKVTGKGGRRNQGRFFLPNMIDEDKVSNTGVITPAHRNQLQNSINDILISLHEDGDPGPPGLDMVILHGSEGAGSTTPTVVDGLIVDGTISTQRRRLR
jgi:hypothetical protein